MRAQPFSLRRLFLRQFFSAAFSLDVFTAVLLMMLVIWTAGCATDESPTSASSTSASPASASSTGNALKGNIASGGSTAYQSRVVFHPSDGSEAALLIEIARTTQERATGLMDRSTLAPDAGMIFVWDKPVRDSFWMKNTYIPLSIAFISPDGTIVDIQDMQALSVETHSPPVNYIYAVEANQGWFTAHGVKAGDNAEFFER